DNHRKPSSGNSRGLFRPRVPGGQWENGAMGNARWTGVRLRDVLDRAGVKSDAVMARFKGLDESLVDGAPTFMKSLAGEAEPRLLSAHACTPSAPDHTLFWGSHVPISDFDH